MADTWTTLADRADGYVVTGAHWSALLGDDGNLAAVYHGLNGNGNMKSATQVITTSTTLVDVTGSIAATFAVTIGASEKWEIDYWIPLSFGSTGGAKFQITGPAAPTDVNITGFFTACSNAVHGAGVPLWLPFTPVTAFATNINTAASASAAGGAVTAYSNDAAMNGIWIRAKIHNGANAGAVTLQAAQNNATSTTTLGIGASMFPRRYA